MTKPSALGDRSGILNLSLLASSSQILSSAESPRGKSHPPVHNLTVPKPVCVLGVMGGECGGPLQGPSAVFVTSPPGCLEANPRLPIISVVNIFQYVPQKKIRILSLT